jgi:hypothetical protein
MMRQAKKLTHKVFDGAGDVAKRVACTTQDLAEQIGPKRGLIGLAIIGAAIGTSVLLARYVRNRRAVRDIGADEGGGNWRGLRREHPMHAH